MIRRHPPRRFRRLCFDRVNARRNALARAVRDGSGPFRTRVKPSGLLYRRHGKHRRALTLDPE